MIRVYRSLELAKQAARNGLRACYRGPLRGHDVGRHLRLLSNFFPGYSVTWPGAFIGFFYGALAGVIIGWSVAWVYNRVAEKRHPS